MRRVSDPLKRVVGDARRASVPASRRPRQRAGHVARLAGTLALREARSPGNGGFTLIEIVAALAVLGAALFVLLDAHYAAMRLHEATSEEVILRQLVETTVAKAEVAVLTGTLSETGDFGERYPDYEWSFDAALVGDDELILLYSVDVSVTGPLEDRSLNFLVYNTGPPEEAGGGSGTVFSGAAKYGGRRPSSRSSGASSRPSSGSSRRSSGASSSRPSNRSSNRSPGRSRR